MAGVNDLLAKQDEFLSLLEKEQLEDIDITAKSRSAIDTITTRLHALEAEEAGVIAQHAQKQHQSLTHTNRLLQQIDERNADPFANFLDGLNVIFNPAQTRKAWAAEANDVARQMELDAAQVEAAKAKMATKKLSLRDAIKQAEAQQSFELDETAEVQARLQKIRGLLESNRQRRAFAADEDAAIARLLERTPPEELTDAFMAEHGITEEQRRRIKMRKSAENIEFERLRRQIQKIREAELLEDIPDINAISYEDAQKMGISRRVLDAERRKERLAKISLAQGEYALRTGLTAEHEEAKAMFLESLGPQDLHALAEELSTDDTTNVTQVGPFTVTLDEVLDRLNQAEEVFAEQAAQETAFAVSQGNTRGNIGIWARLSGGNAPAEMTNLAGLEFLNNTGAVPDEYKPLVALFADSQKRFEELPPESKDSRVPSMVMRAQTFGQATAEYAQRIVEALPADIQPAARDFYDSGKISNPQAAEDVLNLYVIERARTSGNPVTELVQSELRRRVLTHQIPQQEIAALSPSEKRQVQLRSILSNEQHISGIIDMGLHAVSHVTHLELAEQLGLSQLATNLSSRDPKNIIRTERGAIDVSKLHEQIPLYLKEAGGKVTLAQYEEAYVKMATEKMTEAFKPQGDGNLQIAALNTILFDNAPERVIRHAVVSRLAQLERISRLNEKERAAEIEAERMMEEHYDEIDNIINRWGTRRHGDTINEPMMSGIPPLAGTGSFSGITGAELMALADDYEARITLGVGTTMDNQP